MALIYVLLGLLEVDETCRKVRTYGNGILGKALLVGGSKTAVKFRKYMLVRTLMSAVTGLVGVRVAFGAPTFRRMGPYCVLAQLHSVHRSVRRNALANSVRHGSVRVVADGNPCIRVSQRHPIRRGELPRAAVRRQRAVDFTFRRSILGFLLDLRVGPSWSVHRRSNRHRGSYLMRTASFRPLGRRPIRPTF